MADSESLSRTHPATVAVRTMSALGQTVGGLIAFLVFTSFGGATGLLAGVGIAALVLLAVLATVGVQWLNWAYFRYGVVERDLVITEGWLVKKRRSIPIGRIQSIDIRAGLIMRLFGFVDLTIQTAGGSATEPEASIGAIPREEGERLRMALLAAQPARADVTPGATPGAAMPGATRGVGVPAGAEGVAEGDTAGAGAGDAAQAAYDPRLSASQQHKPRYRLSLGIGKLALAAATSSSALVVIGAAIAGAWQLVWWAGDLFGIEALDAATAQLAAAGAALITATVIGIIAVSIGVAIVASVVRDYGFAARRFDERIEIEAGLIERRMTGLPVRRIQSVSIEETALRRLLKLVAVKAVMAGSGRGDESNETSSVPIIPLATRDEVGEQVAGLLPEVRRFPTATSLPLRSLRFYLTIPLVGTAAAGIAAATTVAVTGAASVWLPVTVTAAAGVAVTAWRTLTWLHAGYGTDDSAIVIAHGALGRYRVRISRSRIQTVSIRQNPFQRRAGLATLAVVSVAGTAQAAHVVAHMPAEEAERVAEWFSPSSGARSAA